ncbi:MAG: ion channel [Salibacteraceae bacterium]
MTFIKNSFFLLPLLCLPFLSLAEEEMKIYQDTMTLTQFWTTVMEGDGDSIVELSHVFVTTKDNKEYRDIREYLSKPKTVNHEIEVRDIYFEGYFYEYFNSYHSGGFNIDSTIFEKRVEISLVNCQGLWVNQCDFFGTANLKTDGWLGTKIKNSICKKGLWIFNTNKDENGKVNIENCHIENGYANMWIWSDGYIYIHNSTFGSKNSGDSMWVDITGEMQALNLENDTFNIPVVFGHNSNVAKSVNIFNCQFDKLSVQNVTLPENLFKTYLKWSQIRGKLVFTNEYFIPHEKGGVWLKSRQNYHSFHTDSSISHTPYFDKLKNSANQLYAIYKTQGDMESANACYADIKEFETKRWKYLYQQDKSFETFFRWQLHNTLSYFSDYGTNPAKSVIKSGWIILLFAIFYLFFPSDWDISTKSELFSKLKSLIKKDGEKLDKSTWKFVAYSSLINVLNALTLSINAFTTLGFGDIPTHGAARYVTIIQGFIGWFMLTIFSVSLISQVLG